MRGWRAEKRGGGLEQLHGLDDDERLAFHWATRVLLWARRKGRAETVNKWVCVLYKEPKPEDDSMQMAVVAASQAAQRHVIRARLTSNCTRLYWLTAPLLILSLSCAGHMARQWCTPSDKTTL